MIAEVVAGGGARPRAAPGRENHAGRRGRSTRPCGGFPEMIGGDFAGEVVDPGGDPALVAIVWRYLRMRKNTSCTRSRSRRGGRQPHEEAVERLVMTLEEVAAAGRSRRRAREHPFVIGSFGGFHDSHGGEVFSRWRRRVSTNVWGVGNHGRRDSFGLECRGKPPGTERLQGDFAVG